MNTILAAILMFAGVNDGVGLPPPTPEIKVMIENLGHPDWLVREETNKKLMALERKAVRGLIDAANKNPSPEVDQRARRILAWYFNPLPTKSHLSPRTPAGYTYPPSNQKSVISLPSAWSLPKMFICSDGRNIGWNMAQRKQLLRRYVKQEDSWNQQENEWAEIEVVKDVVHDLLRCGVSRKDVIRLLDEMILTDKWFDWTRNAWTPAQSDKDEWDE